MEFISQIGVSEFCLTYNTEENTIYCKLYTGNEDSPIGMTLAKKKLTTPDISTLTPLSHVFKLFKRLIISHSTILKYFQDVGVAESSFLVKIEGALDKLQLDFDKWSDNQDKENAKKLEALEEEMKVEAEQTYSDYINLLDDLNMTPIEHLINISSWFAAKESMNITAGVLAATSTIWGLLPIWVQIIGASGSGKSKIEESVFEMIPESQIIKGESSLPALYAQAEADPLFFDRKLLAPGDQGSEKDFERNEDMFNIAKKLYTDKAGATRKKMEKLDKNGPHELMIEELRGHCSIFFTTVHEFTDTQHVTRTVSLNPLDDMNAFDEYSRCMSTLTPENLNRKNIIKEADLIRGMIYHKMEVFKDFEFDIINPYYETIIKWTNRLPEPKRSREQLNALLKVIVLFNDQENQKYQLDDGRVIYMVSRNDILLFEALFRLNIGVSVEAMNFYSWMRSKNRKGEIRVKSMIDNEWDELTCMAEPTFDSEWESLFTIKSIRAKVNANQRAFDKKKIGEYVDQLIDVGLLIVKGHDSRSGNNDRIMGLDPMGEVTHSGVPFDNNDVWEYVDKYAINHVWLDEEGRDWLRSFVFTDLNSQIDVFVKRLVPWEGIT